MVSLQDLQEIISENFFEGDFAIAGMVIYVAVLLILFALTRKTQQTLIIAIPTTLIFTAIGALSVDMMVLLIIVAVLSLAYTSRNAWRD